MLPGHASLLLLTIWTASGPVASPQRPEREPNRAVQSVDVGHPIRMSGRLVDATGEPIANQTIEVVYHVSCNWGFSYWTYPNPGTLRTDAEGRFTLTPAKEAREYCRMIVEVTRQDFRWHLRDGSASALFSVPEGTGASVLELGDVCLALAPAPRRCEKLSADDLEACVSMMLRDFPFQFHTRWFECGLTEMVRRGDARFAELLERELAFVKRSLDRGVDNPGPSMLAALRRIQHRRDPLSLQATRDPIQVVELPLQPVFHVRVTNVDELGAKLFVTYEPDDRTFCAQRWSIEVRRKDGTLLEPIPLLGGGCLGLGPRRRWLAPGESFEADLPLAEHVEVTEPGAYEARMHYHENGDIMNEVDFGNRFVPHSEWIPFEIRARTVRIPRALDEHLGKLVASTIDPEYGIRYSDRFDPARAFSGTPRTVEEQLHAAGWRSLRVLFAALDAPAITPRKRAWLLNELHLLTGLHDPLGNSCIGSWRYSKHSIQTAGNGPQWEKPDWSNSWPIDVTKQLEFAAWWKRLGQSFRFEIVD